MSFSCDVMGLLDKLGAELKSINCNKVEMESATEKITFINPTVIKITIKGKVSYQVSGDITKEEFNREINPSVGNQEI